MIHLVFAVADWVARAEVLLDFDKIGDVLAELLPIPLRQSLLISPIDMYPVKKLSMFISIQSFLLENGRFYPKLTFVLAQIHHFFSNDPHGFKKDHTWPTTCLYSLKTHPLDRKLTHFEMKMIRFGKN